jgi:hypothetical protein
MRQQEGTTAQEEALKQSYYIYINMSRKVSPGTSTKKNESTVKKESTLSVQDKDATEITVIGSFTDFKTGQKFPTPSPGYGDRVFYETLLQQRPESHMAQEWCVTYGVLEDLKASKLYAIICKRKGKSVAFPSPSSKKSHATKDEPQAQKPRSRKKAKVETDDGEGVADTGLEMGSQWEGQGSIGI